MIGIVLVSHSPALAHAALELASTMVHGDGPQVAIAAGAVEGAFGTDATRVAEAIAEVSSPDGVLVLMDLGSAVLSAELALELEPPEVPVRLVGAPFVEGLLAALVRAATGGSLEQVAVEADGALVAKTGQLGGPEPEQQPDAIAAARAGVADAPVPDGSHARAEAVLPNAAGLHARPAAELAGALGALDARVAVANRRTGQRIADGASMSSLLALDARRGDAVEFDAVGPQAQEAVRLGAELIASGFGESAERAPSPERPPAAGGAGPGQDGMLGVSPGRAVALTVRMPAPIAEPPADDDTDTDGGLQGAAARIPDAFAAVAAELEARASRLHGEGVEEARAILRATAALASDPALARDAVARAEAGGAGAARAVWSSLGELAERFSGQGGRLAERAADVRDVRDRVVARLRGEAEPGIPDPGSAYVLLAHELAPADTALLAGSSCVAIVVESGGPTSHTAILARSLGIPAVVWDRAASIPDGAMVLVDGGSGEIVIDPSAELIATASARADARDFDGEGRTSDGHPIELLANVAAPATAPAAARSGAQGVGLFRTEFGFLERQTAPSREEQIAAYRQVFAAFPGRKVVVRTLDAGADKPLAFLSPGQEPNPALGIRGYRTARSHPEVLATQLDAIASAARAESAEAWVMAPMISTAAEARAFAGLAHEHGLDRVGVMIETPSAALTAAAVLAELDFVSLGTNDLAQYTMAADRELGELAGLNDAWQPAVLRLIGEVGRAGAAAGKPVGLCGEAGGDPALAPVLIGLGITSLSMTPRALAGVADALRRVSREQCLRAAEAAVGASGAQQARRAAAEVLGA